MQVLQVVKNYSEASDVSLQYEDNISFSECAVEVVVDVASLSMQTMTTIMSEINMRPLGSPT
jgi:hypothetical protein